MQARLCLIICAIKKLIDRRRDRKSSSQTTTSNPPSTTQTNAQSASAPSIGSATANAAGNTATAGSTAANAGGGTAARTPASANLDTPDTGADTGGRAASNTFTPAMAMVAATNRQQSAKPDSSGGAYEIGGSGGGNQHALQPSSISFAGNSGSSSATENDGSVPGDATPIDQVGDVSYSGGGDGVEVAGADSAQMFAGSEDKNEALERVLDQIDADLGLRKQLI